ncbi:hypothetical protein ACQ1Q1_10350 [Ornithobacterium rhinotracheale]
MATVVNPFGKMQGWNKITINLLGRDVVGISELSYSDTTKKENAYGAGNMPVGRTEGNYEAKASITLYKEELDAITKSLPSGKRLQDIEPFDIIVLYDKKGEIRKDRINYCEFTGNSVEVKQNDGSISVKCELIVSHIDWNI